MTWWMMIGVNFLVGCYARAGCFLEAYVMARISIRLIGLVYAFLTAFICRTAAWAVAT